MPKPARFRKTTRVTSGKGGGKRVNEWNCGVLVLYLPGALAALGGAAYAVRAVLGG